MKHNVLLINPTIQPNGVEFLEERCSVFLAPDGGKNTLLSWIAEHAIEAVLTRCEIIDREIMRACPTLKVVGQHGVGLDNIDVAAATECGIKVLNVPDANHLTVAEHTLMFILGLSRSLRINDASVRAGEWYSRENRFTHDVMGTTLLIVGLGKIGKAVAERAKAFGMHVAAYDRFVPREAMEELGIEKVSRFGEGLRKADYVTLHVPLTDETRNMISTPQLRLMKNSAYLVNMGRGPVVDERALIDGLKAGEIAGAGLDVLGIEPPAVDHPFFAMDNVILTPHIGGDTIEAKRRTSEILTWTAFETLEGKETYNWVNKLVRHD
jgi:D-3-phosphoglycerate dehydrogenase